MTSDQAEQLLDLVQAQYSAQSQAYTQSTDILTTLHFLAIDALCLITISLIYAVAHLSLSRLRGLP